MAQDITSNILRLYIIKISKWFMLTMPVIFLFYKENGLGTQELFVLKAVYSVSIVILEVPSGYFGDMWGRKASLVVGSVLGFVGFGLYCFSSGFWGFLACEMILGVGQSFISGSDSAMLYDTLLAAKEEKAYLKTEGKMISFGNFAEALAAPFGVLLAASSLRTPFYFQAVVAFSAVPAALSLMEPKRKAIAEKTTLRNIIAIVRYSLVESRGLRWKIIYSAIIGTATLTMAWFVQPYFVIAGIPLAMYGVLIPLLNITAGMTSMVAYRIERGLGRRNTLFFIALSISSGYFLLGIIESVLFLFLFYFFRGIATPVLRNYINESTPSAIRATVMSIRNLLIRLAFVILGPFLGWHADRAGLPVTLLGGGAIFLLWGIVFAYFSNKEASGRQEEMVFNRQGG